MKLKYLLTTPCERLQSKIGENIQRYTNEASWLDEFFDEPFDAETGIDVSLPKLIESPKAENDFENVKLLYPALMVLTPQQAMDQRLWTHLTHIEYWNYMRVRWEKDYTDEASDELSSNLQKRINQIKDRYFLSSDGNSRSLIRNGIARLWWFGNLTYDPHNTQDPFALTKTLLEYQDTQAALLERTFGKSSQMLRICLEVLAVYMSEIREHGGRKVIQELGKYINRLGGTYFLDTMDKTVLRNKIDAFIRSMLRG
ncbi:MAG: hypothetical protein J6Y92_03655 [Lentisphaeria bacterium]|nr:hypothetical protein [Lentisphaeria bacterium]